MLLKQGFIMTTRVILFLLLAFSITNAEIRYVSKTGSSLPPYTSWATAADSIQKAIDVCSYGDTIYVGSGTYYENVEMIQGLTLLGNGIDSTIIHGGGNIATLVKNDCILKFLRFSTYGDGICLNIVDDEIHPCNSIVEYCMTKGGAKSISSANFEGFIRGSIFCDAYRGISLDTAEEYYNQKVQNNSIFSNENCFVILYGARPEIRNNILISETASIYYQWYVDSLVFTNNLLIADQTIYTPAIWAGPGICVENNVIMGVFRVGIRAGENHSIRNNIITKCGIGIELVGGKKAILSWNIITAGIMGPILSISPIR